MFHFNFIKYLMILVTITILYILVHQLSITVSYTLIRLTYVTAQLIVTLYLCKRLCIYALKHLSLHNSTISKCLLFTGCDTGFGYLNAKRLSDLNFTVFAGCLDVHSKGAVELNDWPNVNVIQLDVTQDEQINHAYQCVSSYCNANNVYQTQEKLEREISSFENRLLAFNCF